jgi:adenine-specific DNA-methyltransferase
VERLKIESKDNTQENIEKIATLFPNVITEMKDESGKIKKCINFEMLKQELSKDVVDDEERYDFTWVGKKAAIVESNTPIRKTLRPCIEESKDWEDTENLFIEGDNLDVLKLLQESYLNSIKMIYIDPPYNTGNDFIYRDNFNINKDEYEEQIGLYDEDDNRLFQNNQTNGRFHSDWCSMIYPRLKLSYNLLSEDGVIFISMDDNEIKNLRNICDEIFGERNFVGVILWKKKTNGNNMGIIPPVHDYILVYAKNITRLQDIGYEIDEEFINKTYSNPDNDNRGPWTTMDLSANHKGPYFSIKNPKSGEEYLPPDGRYWVFNEAEVLKRIKDGRIIFGKSGTSRPVQKVFASERIKGKIRAESWWDKHGMNEDATSELRELFQVPKIFTHPKPSKLICNLAKIATNNQDIILDFFSGSATTAHAVMQLNAEDGGNRKFIIVQLPEETDENSEANKAGYKNICDIGKERIRRAGEKIKSEIEKNNKQVKIGEGSNNVLDVGFRVLKVDSTNMKDVYYSANEHTQSMISDLEFNIKEDRTDLDLLYGVMLDWGLKLSLSHKIEEVEGIKVHIVDEGSLVACFENKVSENAIREIAKCQPLRVVFRDSSFENSPDKINVAEIFKLLAPNTTIKVI